MQPDDPAIVCYTSGSSGRPKGIVHSNANLVHRAWVQSERLGFSPSDRHTLLTTIATGAGLSSVCRVLLSGGTLLWGSPLSVGLDVHWAWLRERRPTVIRATPSLFRSMLRETPEALTLPDVRIVLLGGERVSSADVEACRSLVGPSCLFVNAYSCGKSSNATLFVTRCDEVPADGDLPVGISVSGVHASILDPDGDPVARGETGEVAVTGRYVALGYWRDPERTAARFRTGADGIRTYLTGDLGLIRLDGLLELRGRIDARVKIRGQRIEVEEIERALDEHGDVEASAVVEVAGPEAAGRLAACIVAKDGRAPAPSDLRAFLETASAGVEGAN